MANVIRLRSNAVLWVSFFIIGLPQFTFAAQKGPRLKLSLMVYNYAGFDSRQLKQIGNKVGFIMEDAGIRTDWLNCRPTPNSKNIPAECRQPLRPGDLVIRLVSRSSLADPSSSAVTLAHSFVSQEGGFYGTVQRDVFRRLAREDSHAEIAFIGHAVAHEVWHLLLGKEAHAARGIMRAKWGELDLQRMKTSAGVRFSGEQAESLRSRLAGLRNSR